VSVRRARHFTSPLSAHDARSRLRCAPRMRPSLLSVARPAHRVPDPCRLDPLVVQPTHRGHPSPRPHPTHCLCSPYLLLSISRLLTAERLPDLFSNPKCCRDALPQPPLWMAARRTCQGTSNCPWLSLGHPRTRIAVRHRLPPRLPE
jgi:hypothetical protein